MNIMKEKILKGQTEALKEHSSQFRVSANLERGAKAVDLSKVVDLNEEEDLDEMMQEELVVDIGEKNEEIEGKRIDKRQESRDKRKKLDEQKEKDSLSEQQFEKDYLKFGGIQHIVCSATMTIDNQGRVTPKQEKRNKKKGIVPAEQESTLNALCTTLKFRSKNPKIIDLTVEAGKSSMPSTLQEWAVRCKHEEKDLYLYYFLQQKKGESVIIFCNAITATRRLNSLLDFLKIKNYTLHSKLQQKQRLKSLDRFKRAVNDIESGTTDTEGAILVCTDVAARGLDIPYVSNVVHYQCPFNAEIYVHRCGRTARIGRNGDSLNLLAPEDNKSYKGICQVLRKKEEDI